MDFPITKSEIYVINGYKPPSPASASVSMTDLELSAERDANGYVHRERARQGVRTVSFSYDVLDQANVQKILAAMRPAFFSLTYLDPEYGKHTIQCYASKKDADPYSAIFFNGLWRNLKFNCIER